MVVCLKDGIELPPPISFDIEDEAVQLPTTIQNFICHPDGQEIVRKFLEQYFLIFDSDSREPLMQAYHHDSALYSMTTAYPYGQKNSSAWLNWYSTDNRNILKVKDTERRFKLLKKGSVEIVNFIKEMPESKHDMHSFTVDLVLYTVSIYVFNFLLFFHFRKSLFLICKEKS